MEGEADRDDLRFRLDWPEEGVDQAGDELTDFSFEWDEEADDGAAPEPAEPQFLEPVEVLDSGRDMAFLEPIEALDTVRRALDENNDALRQLSEAVYELASNVRLLVDEVGSMEPGTAVVATEATGGDMTATAMLTLSAEVTASIERLASELQETRAELQGVMDDVVAAAGGAGVDGASQPRVVVELDRVRAELQALKRRFPVRARELDADEIAERVVEALMEVLETAREPAPAPEPPPRRRPKAEPVELPRRAAAKRQRPLRAD